MLRTSNLAQAFPGTVRTWPPKIYPNGGVDRSRDPLNFSALNANTWRRYTLSWVPSSSWCTRPNRTVVWGKHVKFKYVWTMGRNSRNIFSFIVRVYPDWDRFRNRDILASRTCSVWTPGYYLINQDCPSESRKTHGHLAPDTSDSSDCAPSMWQLAVAFGRLITDGVAWPLYLAACPGIQQWQLPHWISLRTCKNIHFCLFLPTNM